MVGGAQAYTAYVGADSCEDAAGFCVRLAQVDQKLEMNLASSREVMLVVKAGAEYAGDQVKVVINGDGQQDAVFAQGENLQFSVDLLEFPLKAGETKTITLSARAKSTALPFAAKGFKVSVQDGAKADEAVVPVSIASKYVVTIEDTARPFHLWMGGEGLEAKPFAANSSVTFRTAAAPVTLEFINRDTTSVHRVHGQGGIRHQDDSLAKSPEKGKDGGKYMPTVAKAGLFYCHDHENSGNRGVVFAD